MREGWRWGRTFAPGSQSPCKAVWPYTEALSSALAKWLPLKVVHNLQFEQNMAAWGAAVQNKYSTGF